MAKASMRLSLTLGSFRSLIKISFMDRGNRDMPFVRVFSACIAAAFLMPAFPIPAHAEPGDEFYEGKTITFVIAGPPAGAYDVYARLAARYLGKQLPGNPAIVARNMPGAGGLLAANYVFNVAPRDGTTLAML